MKTRIGSYEARTQLPRLLRQVRAGKSFTITSRGEAIADLVPSASAKTVDRAAAVERIKAFREAHKMTQEIVYDRRGNATDAYEVPATSYVVVVDAKGKVVYTGLGSDQDIDAAIRKALGQ